MFIPLAAAGWMGGLALVAAAALGWALWLRAALRRNQRELSAMRGTELMKARLEEESLLNADLRAHLESAECRTDLAQRELAALSYAISHDLRAPLRSIDGFSQALIEDYGDSLNGAAHDYLQRVRANVHRLTHLIEDLLMLSRLVRAEFRPETVDLSALADGIIEELREIHPERQVKWERDNGMNVCGDRAMLTAGLRQLLGNAWKFTGPRIHPHIRFYLDHPEKGETVYAICDNGVGFDPNYAGKLFGAFQRMHSPEEFPGNGIGLAAAQRIVHQHRGRIWVESTPDAGATFFFTLAGKLSHHAPAHDLILPTIPAGDSAPSLYSQTRP